MTDFHLDRWHVRLLFYVIVTLKTGGEKRESYLINPIQLTKNELIEWNFSNLDQNGWRKHLSFPLPHILLTKIMDSILLLCVWKGKESQKCRNYGTGLFHLAAKISQPLTESFHRRISVLKLNHLAAVATCILRALTRAEPDVQSIVHLLLINIEKRKERIKRSRKWGNS